MRCVTRIALAAVRSVHQLHEVLAVRIIGRPAPAEERERARCRGLRHFTFVERLERDAHADSLHRRVPDLVHVAVCGARRRIARQREWPAVGQPTIPVGTAFIAEAIEQRVRERGIVAVCIAISGVVSDDAGRHQHLRALGIAVHHDVDQIVTVVRQRDRAPKRRFLRLESAHDRIAEIECRVVERGDGEAVHLDALRAQIRIELAAHERGRMEARQQRRRIEIAAKKGEPVRCVFLDDSELDASNLRHRLAAHLRDELLVARIVARREVPDESPEIGIRLEDRLGARVPRRQHVGPAADGMHGDVLAVCVDGFARDRARAAVRKQIEETAIRLAQMESHGVAIDRFDACDARVVIEPAGLLRLRAKLVETDELVAEQELVRRVDRRVHEPHEREYEVLRDELAAHALERRIGCEVDAFADSHRPRLRVVFGDRQRFGCERHDLRRPREIVVRQQPIEHELENARRRRAGRARRIEPGRLVAQHAMPDLFRIGCERARWRADDDQREQRNTKRARSYGNCRRCPCGHGAGEASGLPFSTIYTATAFAGRSPLRPSCTAPAATLYDSPGFNASGASPSTSSVSMPSTT